MARAERSPAPRRRFAKGDRQICPLRAALRATRYDCEGDTLENSRNSLILRLSAPELRRKCWHGSPRFSPFSVCRPRLMATGTYAHAALRALGHTSQSPSRKRVSAGGAVKVLRQQKATPGQAVSGGQVLGPGFGSLPHKGPNAIQNHHLVIAKIPFFNAVKKLVRSRQAVVDLLVVLPGSVLIQQFGQSGRRWRGRSGRRWRRGNDRRRRRTGRSRRSDGLGGGRRRRWRFRLRRHAHVRRRQRLRSRGSDPWRRQRRRILARARLRRPIRPAWLADGILRGRRRSRGDRRHAHGPKDVAGLDSRQTEGGDKNSDAGQPIVRTMAGP